MQTSFAQEDAKPVVIQSKKQLVLSHVPVSFKKKASNIQGLQNSSVDSRNNITSKKEFVKHSLKPSFQKKNNEKVVFITKTKVISSKKATFTSNIIPITPTFKKLRINN
jgi:hypothetical protein